MINQLDLAGLQGILQNRSLADIRLPGQADIRQTAILKNALQTCEIQLIDHVVVAEDSWYSFADEQLVTEKF